MNSTRWVQSCRDGLLPAVPGSVRLPRRIQFSGSMTGFAGRHLTSLGAVPPMSTRRCDGRPIERRTTGIGNSEGHPAPASAASMVLLPLSVLDLHQQPAGWEFGLPQVGLEQPVQSLLARQLSNTRDHVGVEAKRTCEPSVSRAAASVG